VAAELRDRCVTLGKRVRVALASGEVVGMATEIDDAGRLVVQTDAGPRTVSAGDVVHLRPV
jgi:BirA family biotin operon repressor/biotin-[acetyl-CoA-carboxylase] ligase